MKKRVGYFLFIVSFVAWAAIALLPFTNLSIAKAAAITTALFVAGEITFYLSVIFLGKEFLEKMKRHFRKVKSFKKPNSEKNLSS